MHDTNDIRKSMELDKKEFEIRKAHDKDMLIDEMERRIGALERRLNRMENK